MQSEKLFRIVMDNGTKLHLMTNIKKCNSSLLKLTIEAEHHYMISISTFSSIWRNCRLSYLFLSFADVINPFLLFPRSLFLYREKLKLSHAYSLNTVFVIDYIPINSVLHFNKWLTCGLAVPSSWSTTSSISDTSEGSIVLIAMLDPLPDENFH